MAGAAWAGAILLKWIPVVFLALRAVEARATGRRVDHRGFAAAGLVLLGLATWRYGLDWLRAFRLLARNAETQTSYALPHRLEQLVGRRGHAVEPAQQHDLAGEVVGLDAAQPPGQALPRRPAVPHHTLDRTAVEQVAAALLVLLDCDHVYARRREDGITLGSQPPHQRRELRRLAAQCDHRVGQVHHELAVLPAHDVGAGLGGEGRAPQRRRDRLRRVVHTLGITTEVEDPAGRPRVGDDAAGLQVRPREHDGHRVDPLEDAERGPLVLDAVLGADHGDVRRRIGRQRREGTGRVLALHRQDDHVVGDEIDFGGVPHRGHGQRQMVLG